METRPTQTLFGYSAYLVLDIDGEEVTVPDALWVVERGELAGTAIVNTPATLDAILRAQRDRGPRVLPS